MSHTSSNSSVGLVETQQIHFEETLKLESEGQLKGYTLAYETYGSLNDDRTNGILICHALTGDQHAAGHYAENPEKTKGWWDTMIVPESL